jgi:hypothetical protein
MKRAPVASLFAIAILTFPLAIPLGRISAQQSPAPGTPADQAAQPFRSFAPTALTPGARPVLNCATSNFVTGRFPQGVAVADFNGDGISDLVVTNLSANTIRVLMGNGTFSA